MREAWDICMSYFPSNVGEINDHIPQYSIILLVLDVIIIMSYLKVLVLAEFTSLHSNDSILFLSIRIIYFISCLYLYFHFMP